MFVSGALAKRIDRIGYRSTDALKHPTAVRDILYRNIYTHNSNQMFMIKSNGGSGTVTNVVLANFTGHSNAYTMNFNTAWSNMKPVPGDGIQYTGITVDDWKGTCQDGVKRPPVRMHCPAKVPCTDVAVNNFHVWTQQGNEVMHSCQNAYGTGSCLRGRAKGAELAPYTSDTIVTSVDSYQFAHMEGELTSGLGLTAPIAIPPIPESFYPGTKPIHPVR